ncbi:uncharacterized protein LOC121369771 [Gigantopelta aegis]|uniref:uncharacterized protein LOC121369771 n=1 Tax=Gigantopelta aegis TaxID=1735272 RepID=UPI001B88CDB3|nr:uncharacterized protein LOC121369771 [Gigantopelta aegis]
MYNVDTFGDLFLKFDITNDVSAEERKQEINKSTRFALPVDDEAIQRLLFDTESANTWKNTKQALGVFEDWRDQQVDDIPDLTHFSVEDINKWLSRLLIEVRKADGSPYPPKSLYSILAELRRFCRENGNHINFLDTKNSECYSFRKMPKCRN